MTLETTKTILNTRPNLLVVSEVSELVVHEKFLDFFSTLEGILETLGFWRGKCGVKAEMKRKDAFRSICVLRFRSYLLLPTITFCDVQCFVFFSVLVSEMSTVCREKMAII